MNSNDMNKFERKVIDIYRECQVVRRQSKEINQNQIAEFADNWKSADQALLQRHVVNEQLKQLKAGHVPPVFAVLLNCLRHVKLKSFTLLDAACASGYYAEVISSQDDRAISYTGVDYSESMVKLAKKYHPTFQFATQDLTKLSFDNRSFDVVMASGVFEHIPAFSLAIQECCRVASHYVIVHRLPLCSGPDHRFSKGSQYAIETLRTYFSETKFLEEFSQRGFSLFFKTEGAEKTWCSYVLERSHSRGE